MVTLPEPSIDADPVTDPDNVNVLAVAHFEAVDAFPDNAPVRVYPPVIVFEYGFITNGVPNPVFVVPSADGTPKILKFPPC